MDKIILESNNKYICIEIIRKNYCIVYFRDTDKNIRLGEESLDRVVAALIKAFIPFERNYFTYMEKSFFTILNLMGPLAVIAGDIKDKYVSLYFIPNRQPYIHIMDVSYDDAIEWVNIIAKFLVEERT